MRTAWSTTSAPIPDGGGRVARQQRVQQRKQCVSDGGSGPPNWPSDADPPTREERYRANVRAAKRNGWERVAPSDEYRFRWAATVPVDDVTTGLAGAAVGGQLVYPADLDDRDVGDGVAYETLVRPSDDRPTRVERSTWYPTAAVARHLLVLDLAELEPVALAAAVWDGDWP